MSAEQSTTPPNIGEQAKSSENPSGEGFYVVGIGASAGGLEALEELFEHMPPDTGMAFVVISHQHPEHENLLPELLGRCTVMPVTEAEDGQALEPNRVYINPPGGHLGLMNGCFQLLETQLSALPPLIIDLFFRSLAADLHDHAVCVVLSGTGTDGTLGLQAVKAELGMAIVQEIESARFAGMPSSAAATGLADYVLPVASMPEQLAAYAAGMTKLKPSAQESGTGRIKEEWLRKIFMLLRAHTGHDFSSYKLSTMMRRIERRMIVHHIEDCRLYVRLLQENQHEIDLLFKELLIVVTSFFRDPEAFEVLRSTVIPALLDQLPETYTIRVWVPGCGTGEEAYSLAILLKDCIQLSPKSIEVQIFATDLNPDAVDFARLGCYPDGIASDVPEELLQRHFIHEDGYFRVREEVRKMLIFAQQNIIKDPPFTKIDLLSCRNLLIYLNSDLQKRILPVFHYALKPHGVMMLGPSETIGGHGDLFELQDAKWKIFQRLEVPASYRLPDIPLQTIKGGPRMESQKPTAVSLHDTKLPSQLQGVLLDRLAPPTVVVNNRGDIIYIHGRTGAYLEPRAGQPRMNVHDMAREGLDPALNSAMRQAAAEKKEVIRERLRVRTNGEFECINVSVLPLEHPETMRGLLMISFRPAIPMPSAPVLQDSEPVDAEDGSSSVRLRELEREVQYTKESLQSTVEELETSNEELRSANEELQSANEEMQSTNEELETSKEELQSLNEELSTVNAEMECKVNELSHANDDMQNLLDSTNIATVFLDGDLCIKRYTDQAKQLIKLIPTDVGRSIGDLVSCLEYDSLEQDARTVLKTLVYHEKEVRSRDGNWYLMRIMPYRTGENLISGLVITFVDIMKTKEQQTEAGQAIDYLRSIFDTFHEPSLVLDETLCVAMANRTFYETFKTNEHRTEGELIYDVGGGEWDIAELRELLEDIIPEKTLIENFEVTADFPKIGTCSFLLNARRLDRESGLPGMVLLSMRESSKRTNPANV